MISSTRHHLFARSLGVGRARCIQKCFVRKRQIARVCGRLGGRGRSRRARARARGRTRAWRCPHSGETPLPTRIETAHPATQRTTVSISSMASKSGSPEYRASHSVTLAAIATWIASAYEFQFAALVVPVTKFRPELGYLVGHGQHFDVIHRADRFYRFARGFGVSGAPYSVGHLGDDGRRNDATRVGGVRTFDRRFRVAPFVPSNTYSSHTHESRKIIRRRLPSPTRPSTVGGVRPRRPPGVRDVHEPLAAGPSDPLPAEPSPDSETTNSTSSPGSRSRASRTRFGIVT